MTGQPPAPPSGSPVGPLAQEAAMLLDVVADRLEQLKSRSPAEAAAANAPAENVPAATAAAANAATADTAAAPGPDAPPADEPTDTQTGPAASTAGEAAGADQQPAGADQQPAGADQLGRCPECGSSPGGYCTACPLCRFMALLRGERPEATARLVDGALMIIRTLRSMVPEPADQPAAHQHSHAAGQPATSAHPRPPARRTGLEHINIL